MVLGIGKRTGHTTLKNAKGKSLSPHKTPLNEAVQNYNYGITKLP